ncbi:MAG TPA: hypothetical protein PK771_02495 [Spirochaetota bacterium]|nr:hypothetical protein [Spirochaetota bacterium]
MNYMYVKIGSEPLEMMNKAQKEGSSLILYGTIMDPTANIKTQNRYCFVIDSAESDD